MLKRIILPACIVLLTTGVAFAQPFSRADTVRGTYGPSRNWWNVTHYQLAVTFHLNDSSISGTNTIRFTTQKTGTWLQLDLQAPMQITSLHRIEGRKRTAISLRHVQRDADGWMIPSKALKLKGGRRQVVLEVGFAGKPRKAKNAPWDGGIIWKRDKQGNPFVSIACQGLGASVWYPCKDHQADEPDSAQITLIVPDTLEAISNGRLRQRRSIGDGMSSFTWAVQSPINSYNIIPYIGKYAHWSDTLHGERGTLTLDYWVLRDNLAKAKTHFNDVKPMLRAFEHWFGPYPYYNDGYKLVEAPHLGMEHQSAIAYGNQYKKGYMGRDLSGSGWGNKFDFIIIHESGHEWFGNHITTDDIADMWVQEGFTNYSEALFTEFMYGKDAGRAYVVGLRRNIENDKPVIGPYGVNTEGSGDMYYKGANMIHLIRTIMRNDEKFRQLLRAMQMQFGHKPCTSAAVEQFIQQFTGLRLNHVFDQYLRTTQIPVLEYQVADGKLQYRFSQVTPGFQLPVEVNFQGKRWIEVTEQWQSIQADPNGSQEFSLSSDFYIIAKKLP
jgi:aminopeptidase N